MMNSYRDELKHLSSVFKHWRWVLLGGPIFMAISLVILIPTLLYTGEVSSVPVDKLVIPMLLSVLIGPAFVAMLFIMAAPIYIVAKVVSATWVPVVIFALIGLVVFLFITAPVVMLFIILIAIAIVAIMYLHAIYIKLEG